jgi:nitroreductase
MDVDYLLSATRSARRTLDLDTSVDLGDIRACLDVGLHAANGTNHQSWRWLVITDAETRKTVAGLYRDAYLTMTGGNLVGDLLVDQGEFGRVMASTEWLVENLARVPVFVVPCF